MKNVKLDLSYSNIKQEDIMKYSNQVENIHNELHEKSKRKKDRTSYADGSTFFCTCHERLHSKNGSERL